MEIFSRERYPPKICIATSRNERNHRPECGNIKNSSKDQKFPRIKPACRNGKVNRRLIEPGEDSRNHAPGLYVRLAQGRLALLWTVSFTALVEIGLWVQGIDLPSHALHDIIAQKACKIVYS